MTREPSPQAQAALASLRRATLVAIRQALYHRTDMVVSLNGTVQTIKPQQHPLYAEALEPPPAQTTVTRPVA